MSNSKKPSSKQVWNILRNSCFDPRERTPLSVILETATPYYLAQRAIEEVRKAPVPDTAKTRSEFQQCLKTAISLMAMAQLLTVEEPIKPAKKPKIPKTTQPGMPAKEVVT